MTKVRILLHIGGRWYYGQKAIYQLVEYEHAYLKPAYLLANRIVLPNPKPAGPAWKQAQWAFESLRAINGVGARRLYIFREPRRLRAARSKYMAMMRDYGFRQRRPQVRRQPEMLGLAGPANQLRPAFVNPVARPPRPPRIPRAFRDNPAQVWNEGRRGLEVAYNDWIREMGNRVPAPVAPPAPEPEDNFWRRAEIDEEFEQEQL